MNTCEGPRSYQSTGSCDSTPSTESSSSARSYDRHCGTGCVIQPNDTRAPSRSSRTGTTPAFFFQAEDGIRDGRVTGVQTCALPIYWVDTYAGILAPNFASAFGVF